jgi:hypothetical protein
MINKRRGKRKECKQEVPIHTHERKLQYKKKYWETGRKDRK